MWLGLPRIGEMLHKVLPLELHVIFDFFGLDVLEEMVVNRLPRVLEWRLAVANFAPLDGSILADSGSLH